VSFWRRPGFWDGVEYFLEGVVVGLVAASVALAALMWRG
jgi:hypothetical protein